MSNLNNIFKHPNSKKTWVCFSIICITALMFVSTKDSPVSREPSTDPKELIAQIDILLEKLDKPNQAPLQSSQLYQRADYFGKQALLMRSLNYPKDLINTKHSMAVHSCEQLLTQFPNDSHISTLSAILLLKNALPIMSSHESYITRAQALKGQVDLKVGQTMVSGLLELAYDLYHQQDPTHTDLNLAADLLDLAMEDVWYPGNKETLGGYQQALLDKGRVLLALGQIKNAQHLHDQQLALNPEYFPGLRSNLQSEINKALHEVG